MTYSSPAALILNARDPPPPHQSEGIGEARGREREPHRKPLPGMMRFAPHCILQGTGLHDSGWREHHDR
jgi:hypothetical protein